MAIKELPPPKSMSDKKVIDFLYDALETARRDKVSIIAIIMDLPGETYSTFEVVGDAPASNLFFGLKQLEDQIKKYEYSMDPDDGEETGE